MVDVIKAAFTAWIGRKVREAMVRSEGIMQENKVIIIKKRRFSCVFCFFFVKKGIKKIVN